MSSVETELRPGEILDGKYRIESLLGVGGMGVVLAATHLLLGSRVAIKVRRGGQRACASRTRILNEARGLASIASDHVARVTDAGVLSSGDPYIVMELLDGEDLSKTLAREGKLPVGDAVEYVFQAIEGLAEAHGRGIIHRDIKPSNLFLANLRGGRRVIKVLDFGISKFDAERIDGMQGVETGPDLLGTPAYMSPEQIRTPKTLDARSDIWSLAVVLYELCAGVRPFDGETFGELFTAILERPAGPLSDTCVCDAALAATVSRCLSPSPDDRFPDVASLADALASAVADGPARSARIRAALLPSTRRKVSSSFPLSAPEAAANARATPRSAIPAATRTAWSGVANAEGVGSTRPPPHRRLLRALVAVAVASFLAFLIAGLRLADKSLDAKGALAHGVARSDARALPVDVVPPPNALSANLSFEEAPRDVRPTPAATAPTSPAAIPAPRPSARRAPSRPDAGHVADVISMAAGPDDAGVSKPDFGLDLQSRH